MNGLQGNEGGYHWRNRTFEMTKERGYAVPKPPSQTELNAGKVKRRIEDIEDARALKAATEDELFW